VIGSYITFHLAQRAGMDYLIRKFGKRKAYMQYFERWGTIALVVSCAVPLPFPTSVLFAAAGASGYSTQEFLFVVALSRGVRYSAVAIVADLYGRHFLRVLRHPAQYWPWLILIAVVVGLLTTLFVVMKNRLQEQTLAPGD
jgi:uncharacterized membrane protein YdjX (TVP38/TMEM64 family)